MSVGLVVLAFAAATAPLEHDAQNRPYVLQQVRGDHLGFQHFAVENEPFWGEIWW